MFDRLGENIGAVFDKLRGRGHLSEADVNSAMREIRIALLEADVALPVVKDFIARVKERAIGEEVIKSVSPAQMVVKIVHDNLTQMLGGDSAELAIGAPPSVVMMVGLQGSGKTTSTAKLALHLRQKHKKKALMASLDTARPAAQEQLATLGTQVQIDTLEIVPGQTPRKIAQRAMKEARVGGYDVLFLDTAGRLHIDDTLMEELEDIKQTAQPAEIMFVADSLTGQDAVNTASAFHERLDVTGIILTRIDGDGRGGAALSMRAVTGRPIKFLGVGEKLTEIEPFHPDRIASRILDMGDVVSLVEKAVEIVDQEEARKMERRMKRGQFDFNDLAKQLQNIRRMGGMGGLMKMIPGMGKLKDAIADGAVDEKVFARQQAIISSMTAAERSNPSLLNGSRKKRIAAGSGTSVPELNRLIKQYKQMQSMMKKLGKMDKKSMMRNMQNMMGNM